MSRLPEGMLGVCLEVLGGAMARGRRAKPGMDDSPTNVLAVEIVMAASKQSGHPSVGIALFDPWSRVMASRNPRSLSSSTSCFSSSKWQCLRGSQQLN
jgi:hypothetical protein